MNKLVSIITPCYNGAKYLPAFLQSVINQDYQHIELVFIDDGSVDDTKVIFDTYAKKMHERGILTKYFYQTNAGQAAAINVGLREYTGGYIMWMDADDILETQNISKKVKFLIENPEFGFVFCQGYMVHESDYNEIIGTLQRKHHKDETTKELFWDYLNAKNVLFVPASILVKSSVLKRVIPNNSIYESIQGQNWQLMLPLAYSYPAGYIDESLFRYVIHEDSHSHQRRNKEQEIERNIGFKELLFYTLNNIKEMNQDERDYYKSVVKKIYAKSLVRLFIQIPPKQRKQYQDEIKECIKELNGTGYKGWIYRNILRLKIDLPWKVLRLMRKNREETDENNRCVCSL
jgi:glycosyltransferase involved in cell wall biosynthesis